MQKEIISVLIGLVGACNSNPKTDNTDRLLLNALAFPLNGCDEQEIIAQLRAEKNVISPECATCATPCGNTSDFDMNGIDQSTEICTLKQQALAEICQMAAFILQNGIPLTEDVTSVFYKALSYVSYDLTEQTLRALLTEIQEKKLQMESKL